MQSTIETLTQITPLEAELQLRSKCQLPSVDALKQLMRHISGAIFPHFFGTDMHVDVSSVYAILRDQIACGIAATQQCQPTSEAHNLALQFVHHLPDIKQLLLTDIAAVTHNDPAATSGAEAVFCYPGIRAMLHYRTAHELVALGVPMLPRIISELAHADTGIDIHPAAQIGPYFAIDHGTGIVIGETAIVGHHVMLYQGVTLGARNFQYDNQGHPMNIPRHPIVEDNVTIYSNTSVLGRITIGHDSIIGGNIWLTHDIPPHSRITQAGQKE